MGARAPFAWLALAALSACERPPPAVTASAATPRQEEGPWRTLEPGLDLGTFEGALRVLRADPARFALRLLSASATGGEALVPSEWARRHDLLAVINASMYQQDGRTSVGLMRTRGHVNNQRLGKDKAVLAFDPVKGGEPPVRIIDRECDHWPTLSRRYGTLVQSIRMVSCRRRNVWARQAEAWSTAAIGLDGAGRVLFLHAREPRPTDELIRGLLDLPLDLRRALYTEGGPQAQLYVKASGEELSAAGEPESPLLQAAVAEWPLPNIVGVARR